MGNKNEPTYGVEIISKLFNLTPRRVQQLAKEGIIPKAGRGKYPLAASVRGYITYLQGKVENPDADGRINLNEERARKLRAEADLAEMEVAKRRGDLIDAGEVTEAWQMVLGEVRANLLNNVPVRVAALVKTESKETVIKALVKAEIKDALRKLSEADAQKLLGDDVDVEV